MIKPVFINWSGGKDCTFALHKILEEKEYHPEFLFTTCSREHQRVSMHGVRKELITRQGLSLGIKSRKMYVPQDHTIETYNKFMFHEMQLMKQRGIDHAVFGDIFLEDLKKYREKKLEEVGLTGLFPLWKRDTKELLREFIALGYKTMVICINAKKLDRSFLGRTIDEQFISDLPADVDCCGENGEFHTFVYEGPVFKDPIGIEKGEEVYKEYKSSA
ncbi:MAG: diphthine--ammonia ligase, partial [Bacteroidia bacterium]